MSPPDSWGERYLQLVLRIERHVPGYVDAYIGPPALRQAVQEEAPRLPAALLQDVADLQAELPRQGYEENRRLFLEKQLWAIETMVRKLAGETLPYREEVQRCFDIVPPYVPEETFLAAHDEMAEALPGEGTLVERLQAYRDRFIVPAEKVLPLVQTVLAEIRRRTRELVPLPAEEGVEVVLVRERPWGAYNWFLGGARSRIELNTDLPTRALGLVGLFAHEAYPGHHTEATLKESLLYRGQGRTEMAVYPLNTPAGVVSEGLADYGVRIIFEDEERIRWQNEVLYPQAGLSPVSVEQALRLEEAGRQLRFVSGNAALLLHEQGWPAEEVAAYIERYALRPPEEARHTLKFLQSPLFRAYIFCYATGETLIEQAMERTTDRRALFVRLLQEAWTPSALAALGQG